MDRKNLSPADETRMKRVLGRMIVAHAQHERAVMEYLRCTHRYFLSVFSEKRPTWIPAQELRRLLLQTGVRCVRFEGLSDDLFNCGIIDQHQDASTLFGVNKPFYEVDGCETDGRCVVDYLVFTLLIGLAEQVYLQSITPRSAHCDDYSLTVLDMLEDPAQSQLHHARRVLRRAIDADQRNLERIRELLCFRAPTAYRLFEMLDSSDDALALHFDLTHRSASENHRLFNRRVVRLLEQFRLPTDLLFPYS